MQSAEPCSAGQRMSHPYDNTTHQHTHLRERQRRDRQRARGELHEGQHSGGMSRERPLTLGTPGSLGDGVGSAPGSLGDGPGTTGFHARFARRWDRAVGSRQVRSETTGAGFRGSGHLPKGFPYNCMGSQSIDWDILTIRIVLQ